MYGQSSDNDVLTALYTKHANYVYSIALSYLHHPEDAEDATADIFVKLLEQPRTFANDTEARAWLVVAVRNHCKNILKSWVRKNRDDDFCFTQIPSDGQNDELKAVMAALYALPERYRLPLLLHAVEGYSIAETAQILRLNESTVRTRIERARKKLRKEMEDEAYGQAARERS